MLLDNRSRRIYKKSKNVVEYTVSRYPARSYGEDIRGVGAGVKASRISYLIDSK